MIQNLTVTFSASESNAFVNLLLYRVALILKFPATLPVAHISLTTDTLHVLLGKSVRSYLPMRYVRIDVIVQP